MDRNNVNEELEDDDDNVLNFDDAPVEEEVNNDESIVSDVSK